MIKFSIEEFRHLTLSKVINISIKKIFHFKNLKIKKEKKHNRSFNP